MDRRTGAKFLVDTGLELSVLPRGWTGRQVRPASLKLYAANGTPIRTYGERRMDLNLGLRRSYVWPFIVADVSQPILGADFLSRYNLLVDMRSKRLIDGITGLKAQARLTDATVHSVSTLKRDTSTHYLLKDFIEITRPGGKKSVKHEVRHHIVTKRPPFADKVRRLTPERQRFAKSEIQQWVADGVCKPGSGQ
ncbi:uncharacterized protein LOC109861952 [Pseudomyrmex gracilis]|uniref:uncharacterized protein LOC109861952 n=1 Tax=Pseudomyrmex gracilis TaxID=219809 RepID=UPI000994FD4F|nr:uncharacterized protein LOC109861952 [Pseudomyrmex gracilis]